MAETLRQIGDTSIFVDNNCKADVNPLLDAASRIPLTELSCGGSCVVGENARKAVFGVKLDAPEGDVSDSAMLRYLEAFCPYLIKPEAEEKKEVPAEAPQPQLV